MKCCFQTNSQDFATLFICSKNVAEIEADIAVSVATCYVPDLLSVRDQIAPTESVKLATVN
jgi:hypothetical protein